MENTPNYSELLRRGMRSKRKKKDTPAISGRGRLLSEDKPNAGRDLEDMLKPEKTRKKKGQ